MLTLLDHHTCQRHADLRAMQGLPIAVPAGYTLIRKSDFARPRRTALIGLAVIAAGIVYASNLPTSDAHQPSAERETSVRRTVCAPEFSRFARPIRSVV